MIILVLITDGIWVLGTSQLFKHLKSVKAGALRLLSNPLLLILPPFHPPSVIQQKKKRAAAGLSEATGLHFHMIDQWVVPVVNF